MSDQTAVQPPPPYQNKVMRAMSASVGLPKESPALIDAEVHIRMMSELEKLKVEVEELRKLKPFAFSTDRWNGLIRDSVAKIIDLEKLKAQDYATSTDRLASIRSIATELNLPMLTTWAVLAAKHWRVLVNHVRGAKTAEPISSRVDDLIVYLILFKAILEEQEHPTRAQASPSPEA